VNGVLHGPARRSGGSTGWLLSAMDMGRRALPLAAPAQRGWKGEQAFVLGELGVGTGRKVLHWVLYQHVLRKGNGPAVAVWPGLEPGPQGFSVNPAASYASGTANLIFPEMSDGGRWAGG
jgi:hypothetical protein